MDDSPDWTVLGRYLRGECSPEETAAVARWVEADAANAEELEFLREIWYAPAVTRPPVEKERGWQALQASIAAAREPVVRPLRIVPVASTESRWRRRVRGAMAGLAAAAVVAAAVGVVTWRQHADAHAPATQPSREYVTARGQRTELLLADGTRVWLNADSRLRLLAEYGLNARDVSLEGEAYFAVAHDATRPFRVHTRGTVSEDLGTEFNVRAYGNDDDQLVVAVAAGRVAVRPTGPTPLSAAGAARVAGAGAGAELGAGQVARLARTGELTIADNADLSSITAWRDGALRFTRRPLADVLHELERWYDVDIVLDDSALARVPVTTSLGGRTADQALALLASALDVNYTRTTRVVHFGGPPPGH